MKRAPQEIRTYLVTAVTAQRRRLFQMAATAELLLDVVQQSRSKGRFDLYAFAVMPDHVHLLLTPAAEVSLEKCVQYIKGGFSFRFKSQMDVWERGYDARRVEDAEQFEAYRTYVEANPVRAGLVAAGADYPFCSGGSVEWVDAAPSWFAGAKAPSRGAMDQWAKAHC